MVTVAACSERSSRRNDVISERATATCYTAAEYPFPSVPLAGMVDFDDNAKALVFPGYIWDAGRFMPLEQPPGSERLELAGLDNRGDVAGTAVYAGPLRRAFLWRNRIAHEIMTPVGSDANAVALNEKGHVVGTWRIGTDPSHAYLFREGTLEDLGEGSAVALNASDHVLIVESIPVGEPRHPSRAWLWRDGTRTTIEIPPGRELAGFVGLNARDEVAGNTFSDPGDGTAVDYWPLYPFLWTGGVLHQLPTLGGPPLVHTCEWHAANHAYSINDRGDVVGSSSTKDGEHHAVLWREGTIHDLGFGGAWSSASKINDRGQILGSTWPTKEAICAVIPIPVVWEDGIARALPTPPGFDSVWFDLNERGDVVEQVDAWDGHGGFRSRELIVWKAGQCVPDAGTDTGPSREDAEVPPPAEDEDEHENTRAR